MTRKPMMVAGLLLSLFVLACGQPPSQQVVRDRAEEDISWLGVRPTKTLAAKLYDEGRECLREGGQHDDWMAVGRMAFDADTVPALVAVCERGNLQQIRSAWIGLRALVVGIAVSAYVDGMGEYDIIRSKVMPVLPAYHSRLTKALERMPEPQQKAYREILDMIVGSRP